MHDLLYRLFKACLAVDHLILVFHIYF